jgi:hypothetical protein
VLQLPPLQPLQEEDAAVLIRLLAAPLSPPLLKAHTDMTRCTFSESHLGQFTDSSLLNTNRSNFSQHWQHSYSKIGISNFLLLFLTFRADLDRVAIRNGSEISRIFQNPPDDVDRAGRANFIPTTDRSRSKEDAKRLPCRPITQIAHFDNLGRRFVKLLLNRHREVYLVAPGPDLGMDGQGCHNGSPRR